MISIIVFTEKNKLSDYMDTRVPQGAFSDKVTPDIDDVTDEPVV